MQRPTAAALKLGCLVVAFGAILYVACFTHLRDNLNPHAMMEALHAKGQYKQTLYMVACAAGTVLMAPDTALNLVGAVVFGPYTGTLLAWTGVMVGAMLAFWIARWLGRDFVVRILGDRLAAFDQKTQNNGFKGLLLIRLLPIAPFSVVSYVSGLTTISHRDYVLATALGTLPMTFLYQYFFARMGSLWFSEEGQAHSHLHALNIVLAMAAGGLVLYGAHKFSARFHREIVASDKSSGGSDMNEPRAENE